MPTWTNQRPSDPFMTVALLIALAGSLAAMAVIVRRLENDEQVLELPSGPAKDPRDAITFLSPEMCGTVR